MKVAFRTDASLQIGTGHVMRCLALADALTAGGAECQFICRAHEGNLIEFIRNKGYVTHSLPIAHESGLDYAVSVAEAPPHRLAYSNWLGASQLQDVCACATILKLELQDWIIVDHYALDALWERKLASYYRKLMVIDDLADRPHSCDLLLDQTFSREASDYRSLVPARSHLLCGSTYALLRPEFAAIRAYSLRRRSKPNFRELLIAMGGIDKDNATGYMLQVLRGCFLPDCCRITVVMGAKAPWLNMVRKQAQDMPWPTRVLVGISDMAQIMADSDLAIGAAGVSSWERCCLGLPTIMIMLAENQRKVAEALERLGAAKLLDQDIATQLREILIALINDASQQMRMSECAASIVDGLGVNYVMQKMEA